MPYLVGIAGGSCSGKTVITTHAAALLSPGVSILTLDSYYRDNAELSLEARARINYDEAHAFEVDLACAHLDELLAGRSIRPPRYCYESHSRVGVQDEVPAGDGVLLLEGILVLAIEELRARLHKRVFIDCPRETRLARRVARDTASRGRSAASITEQFARDVDPMHELWVEPSAEHAELLLDGCAPITASAQRLVQAIQDR